MTKISKQIQKIMASFIAFFLAAVFVSAISLSQPVSAASSCDSSQQSFCNSDPAAAGGSDGATSSDGTHVTCVGIDCLTKYLNPFIKLLSALVGIVVTISIVYAGIQYSSARDQSSKIEAAKKRIGNALIALVAWLLMMTFLQWLIPGGLF